MIPGLDIIAQVPVAPNVTNWVQLAGFVAILFYMGYGQWITKENARTIKANLEYAARETKDHLELAAAATTRKLDESNKKTDQLHDMWNSRLDEFKQLFTENAQKTMEAQRKEFESTLAKMHADHDAKIAADRTEFDRRIAAMESLLKDQKLQTPTIVPVEIVNQDPVPVVQTPEKRLEQIRGQDQ